MKNETDNKYKITIMALRDNLKLKKRDDGTEFVVCEDNDEFLEVIRELHDNLWPNDFIFASIDLILLSLEDYNLESTEDLRDAASEIADSQVEIYNHELLTWSKTFYHYIDEYYDELGVERQDFITQIRQGQWYQLDKMAHRLVDFIIDLTSE